MKQKQHKISFLIAITEKKSNLQQAGDFVRGFLTRSKSDHEVIFADLVGAQGFDAFQSSKALADFVDSGRVKFIAKEASLSVAGVLKKAAELAEHSSHVYLESFEGIQNIHLIQTWFSGQKEVLKNSDVHILLPASGKNKEGLTLFSRIKNGMLNFPASLLLNGACKEVVNAFVLYTSDAFSSLISQFKPASTDILSLKMKLMSASALAGFRISEVKTSIKPQALKNVFSGWLHLLSAAIKIRFSWYFLIPLSELRKQGLKGAWEENHSLYRMLFFLLFATLGIWMPFLSQGFGISWDERAHSAMGKDILDYFITFGADKKCLDTTIPHHIGLINYGLSFDTFTAFVNKYISPFGEFETRHFLNAFVGFIGMVFVALAAKRVSSWRAAVVAFLMIFLSPYYLGHAMNNPKDIPFATGYIASIYYILVFLEEFPNPKRKTLIFLTLAIAYAISIRIAGLLMLAYLGLFTGFVWLAYAFRNDFKKAFNTIPRLALVAVVVAFSAYMLGILCWPYALQKPFENPFTALASFTNWSLLTSYELFEGNRIYMSELPWNYIVKLILIMTPLFVWAGMVFLLPAIAMGFKKVKTPVVALLLFTCLFPIAYAYYKHSTMFNGWRHMLFTYPPLVVVAAMGWDRITAFINNTILRTVILVLFLGLFTKTAVWCVQNHPNEYVYYNEFVGGVDGAYGNYETDPYGNCMRAGVEWLIKNEHLEHKKSLVVVNQETLTADYYAKKIADSVTISWTREYEVNKQRWDYAILTTRTMSKNLILSGCFPPKGTIHVIYVEKTPIVAIVKRENEYLPDAYKYLEAVKIDSAESCLRKAIEYDPKNEEAYRMLAMAQLTKGNNTDAEKTLDLVLRIYPESYIAYYLKGYLYMNLKNPEAAIPMFDKSISYKINYADPYFAKGKALEMKKEYRLAIDQFDLAYKYGNQNFKTLNEAAFAYILLAESAPDAQKTYYNKAIGLYLESLKKNGNQADVYQNLGYGYLKLGDKTTSDQYYQKSAQLRGAK